MPNYNMTWAERRRKIKNWERFCKSFHSKLFKKKKNVIYDARLDILESYLKDAEKQHRATLKQMKRHGIDQAYINNGCKGEIEWGISDLSYQEGRIEILRRVKNLLMWGCFTSRPPDNKE